MCHIRHVGYPGCHHPKVDIWDFCWPYLTLPHEPYKCPEPESVTEEWITVSKAKAVIVAALDRVSGSVNEKELPGIRLPLLGCPTCRENNAISVKMLHQRMSSVMKLWNFVKQAEKANDPDGNEERQKLAKAAERLLELQAAKNKEGVSLYAMEPFFPRECMALLLLGLKVEGGTLVETDQDEVDAQKDL
ncbi:MAG: hypothetical protein Q9181_007914 [Wetmoreana brouardii]